MEPYLELEQKFAEFNQGEPDCYVACSSGSASLHLALETLQVTERWDTLGRVEIVVPDFTMIACPRSVTLSRMHPRFSDVDELGLIVPKHEDCYGSKAVMSVHTYGRKARTRFWGECYGESYQTNVIEDLSEAHGIKPNPNSLAACWSFYRNKVIAGEEGGMVAFPEKEQASLARKLRNMGFDDNHNFWHIPRGWNYRLSNCHAELILKSLYWHKNNLDLRRTIEGLYNRLIPRDWQLPNRQIPWVYDLDLPIGVNVDQVVRELREQNIQARCSFKPLSQQLEYRAVAQSQPNTPIAQIISRKRMYLPIYPELGTEQIKQSVEALEQAVENQTVKNNSL